ncbi:hypothetical protein M3Y97_00552300 [Aphelenchoides bicaudatus]|nr:hypothetical protein M3Y97_00552300 [Aphelenchoides bicaudatus]
MNLVLLLILLFEFAECQLQRKVAVLITVDNGGEQLKLQHKIQATINESLDDDLNQKVKLVPEFIVWNTTKYEQINALQVAHDLVCPFLLNDSVAILLVQATRRQKVAEELFASIAYIVSFYSVPVLGVVRSSPEFLKQKYSTFLQLTPSFSNEVNVFVQLLTHLQYRNVILITINNFASHEFVFLFKQKARHLQIQKHIELDESGLKSNNFKLDETSSNTIVQEYAEQFFDQQYDHDMQIGRVWIVNEAASRSKNLPVGILAVRMHLDLSGSVQGAMMVLKNGAQILAQFNESSLPPPQCKKMMRTANEWTNTKGMNNMAKIEVDRKAMYEIVNSQPNGQFNIVGFMHQHSTLVLDEKEIVWPGGSKTKPLEITLPKHLRCLTVPDDPPFVFSFAVANGTQCYNYSNIKMNGVNVVGPWIECFKKDEATQETLTYCCSGFAVEFLIKLSQMKVHGRQQAFTFDLFMNQSYGAVLLDKDGGYYLSGMLGELDSGRSDLAIGALSVNPERKLHIGLSVPWLYHGIQILEKWKAQEAPLSSFTQPFKRNLWFALGVSVVFVGIAIYILDKNSPFEQFEQYDTDSLSNANNRNLTSETRLTFGESFLKHRKALLVGKLLGVAWCAFCLIFVASFTANLAAFLVLFDEKETNLGISDQRFRNPSDGFSFATVQHTNTYQYFKRQIEYSTMFRKMESYNFKNSQDAIQALLNNSLEYEAARHCNLRTRGPIFGKSAYAVGLQKNSPWIEHISTAILKLSEDGTLASLNDKWIINAGHTKCERYVRKTPARLGLQNMYEIFVMLGSAILIGAVMSAVEVWFGRRREQEAKTKLLAQNYALKWRSHLSHSETQKRSNSMEPKK